MSDCVSTSQEMSSVNSNRNQDNSVIENTVDVVSPFHNEIECFDNAEAFPDMELVVKGIAKPLLLHRKILASASGWFRKNLNGRKDMRLEWPFDTSKEVDREALLKGLRFCYGQTLTVGSSNGECVALIAAFSRLELAHMDEAVSVLTNFGIEECKGKIETGVELLKACVGYGECCDAKWLSLDMLLAAIVLTKDNMVEHYKEVVDDCLMMLPAEYLSMADFGAPHTRWSEFSVRAKYVRIHSKQMTQDEKQQVMMKCDWATLKSQELRELRLADVVDKDEVMDAQEKSLEYQEIENERMIEMMKRMEKKMDEKLSECEKIVEEENGKTKKAEEEREVFRHRVDDLVKENETLMKQLDDEKEVRKKEREGLEARLEQMKKEMEEEKDKAKKTEDERDQLRQRLEQVMKENEDMKREAAVFKARSERYEKQICEMQEEIDELAKELDEHKERLAKAEAEREKHWSRVDGLESFVKDNRLF